jgi:hypothetical protein
MVEHRTPFPTLSNPDYRDSGGCHSAVILLEVAANRPYSLVMNRRGFLRATAISAIGGTGVPGLLRAAEAMSPGNATARVDPDLARDWLARWEQNILGDMQNRYCDKETGEEVGWRVSPFLNGFYYGYEASHKAEWIDRLVDWTDAWIRRGVKEPDGFVGWPKADSGGAVAHDLFTDSLLGEAMALRPIVLMAGEIERDPSLKETYGAKAKSYLALANQVYEKWVARGCWREVKEGGLWLVPEFGINRQTGHWTEGYEERTIKGFSNPANKQNHIARWLLAMGDVTKNPVFHDHAQKWARLMKSRMRLRDGGKYFVWNYWDPAGPWDFKPDGTPRHWVGVHPNGGYYEIDVEGIVAAFEHGLVFTKADVQRLVATNRDFMWDQHISNARFQRIDGGQTDPRWSHTPGVLWTALIRYDARLREIFLSNHNPASWGGLTTTPWFLAMSEED